MSMNSIPTRRSAAPIPVPVEGAPGSVPVTVDAQARLEADIAHLARAIDRRDVGALRRAQSTVPRLRQCFAQVDRPATAEEIVLGVNGVVRTMAMAGTIDPEEWADSTAAELAAEGATLFEIATAVRQHKRTSEFVSLPKLLEEIERARRVAARHRRTLAVEPAERVALLEDEIRRAARERERLVTRVREAVDELRADGGLTHLLERGTAGTHLTGVGHVSAKMLMEVLEDDERERFFALALPPDQDRLLYEAPEGWLPPGDERVAEILEEARDEEEAAE